MKRMGPFLFVMGKGGMDPDTINIVWGSSTPQPEEVKGNNPSVRIIERGENDVNEG